MNNTFIKVSPARFREIFAYDRYQSKIEKINGEWSSCPWYDVIDRETNEIVGGYSDGSWENTYEVIIDLVSKDDIVAHYEKLLDRERWEVESYKKYNKKLREYKNLTPEQRLEVDEKERAEIEWRKTHPGLMAFLGDGNLIRYDINTQGSSFSEMLNLISQYYNKS